VTHWLVDRLEEFDDQIAIIWKGEQCSYRQLRDRVLGWDKTLQDHGIQSGECVALCGDYSLNTCTLLLALITNGNITVPLSSSVESKRSEFLDMACVSAVFDFDQDDSWAYSRRDITGLHPLLNSLREQAQPGLVLFSSGSTGQSKAVVHNFDKLIAKFQTRRRSLSTLTFLLLDHIGGINTLLYTLSNGGTVVSVETRSPETICQAIERYQIQLLPTSPTFLNLLLISEAYKEYDLSSLEMITYGTEPMPGSTLQRLNQVFPKVGFKQTYGLSELGIMGSQSKDSNSLWLKVGGDGYETKVVEGVLWIRANSAMLGYLNAPDPFDEEGWFNTEDIVKVSGEYMRILGRDSEIINVGGEKVYPAEVESVLMEMENIQDITISSEPNPITGRMVVAVVNLEVPEDPNSLKRRMREFCKDRLERYKVPVKVQVTQEPQVTNRFKKARTSTNEK
jgi:long-chain acyl-CoA synthetase